MYIIGPDKTVKLTLTYPESTGRNFVEILRVIDSLQLTARHSVVTPVNWVNGDDCFIEPTIREPRELREKFPRGYRQINPYLRLTPQPDK